MTVCATKRAESTPRHGTRRRRARIYSTHIGQMIILRVCVCVCRRVTFPVQFTDVMNRRAARIETNAC